MNFFTDLWYDLREKRLWPVAAGLLVALIAVPIFLLKPSSEEATAPVTATTAGDTAQLPVASTAEGNTDDSTLGIFDPKDPFKPPAQPRQQADGLGASVPEAPVSGGSTQGSAGDGASGAGGSGSAGSDAGGGSGSGTPAAGDTPASGGSDGSGGSGGSGGSDGSGNGSGGGGGDTTPPKPVTYTYVVDLKFGERGNVRDRRNVQRLTVLPNEENPLLVFLGVTETGKGAKFLVNSKLEQEGEGDCEPSNRICTFLELRDEPLFDEHLFTNPENGKRYVLRLMDIKRVSLATAQKAAAAAARSRPWAGASRASAQPFELPIFGDEVVQ